MRLKFDAPLDFDPELCRKFVNDPDADIWVTDPLMDYVIDDAVLDTMPQVRVIATPSTGRNHIDLEACERRGIKVLSLLDDRTGLQTITASAEFTFQLVLAVLRLGIPRELSGRRVGIVGYGRIGHHLVNWLTVFGAEVRVHDPAYPIASKPLKQIFGWADVVVVCCALNAATQGMITGQLIERMKRDSRLVNTARGEVIDEPAMKAVLDKRPDVRVALDVLTGETTGTQDPDWFLERGHIVTPHIAGNTFDSRTKAARIILQLLEKELANERQPA